MARSDPATSRGLGAGACGLEWVRRTLRWAKPLAATGKLSGIMLGDELSGGMNLGNCERITRRESIILCVFCAAVAVLVVMVMVVVVVVVVVVLVVVTRSDGGGGRGGGRGCGVGGHAGLQ